MKRQKNKTEKIIGIILILVTIIMFVHANISSIPNATSIENISETNFSENITNQIPVIDKKPAKEEEKKPLLYGRKSKQTESEIIISKGEKIIEKLNLSKGKIPKTSNKADIEFTFKNSKVKSIKIPDAKIDEISLGFEEVPTNKVNNYGFDTNHAFAINPQFPEDVQNFSITFIATGTSLLKCQDYDFENQSCYGEFVKILDTVPGKEYTIDLSAVDPLFLQVTEGLVMHFDAASITGLNDNDDIITWSDISGNSNHAFQTNPALRPTYQTNTLNGLAVVNFNKAAGEQLDTPWQPTSGDALDSGGAIFIVVRSTDSGDRGIVGSWDTPRFYLMDKSGGIQSGYGDAWVDSGTFPQNEFVILSLIYDGANAQVYNNGTLVHTYPASFTGDNTNTFGVGHTNGVTGRDFGGDIAEVIVYNVTVDSSMQEQIRSYLHAKWFESPVPQITLVTPLDSSDSNSLNTNLSIQITDSDQDNMKVSFYWANNTPIVTADSWYDDYDYRRQIDLSMSSSSSPANYQFNIIINSANMGANFNWSNTCDDIRFIDPNTSKPINYWIESCSSANQNASIWIKVENLITTSDYPIYLYYGKNDATSQSNGEKVFDFFDDFSGDLSKWTEHKNAPNINLAGGYVELGGGSTTAPYGHSVLGSDASYSDFIDGIIEGDIYFTTDSIAEIGTRGDFNANTGYKSRIDARSSEGLSHLKPPYVDSSWGFLDSCATTVTSPSLSTWVPFKLTVVGTSLTIESEGVTRTCSDSDYVGPGEISLQNHYGSYTRYDNIRVRKYASGNQIYDIGTEESGFIYTSNSIVNASLSGLSPLTTYNWYVTIEDLEDKITSPTWSFTTGSDGAPVFSSGEGYFHVQRGTFTMTETTSDISIDPVNTSQSFILISTRANSDSPSVLQVTGTFVDESTIRFQKYSTTSTIVSWEVISSSELQVYRNQISTPNTGTSQLNENIGANVNLSQSFIIVHNRINSGTNTQNVRGLWRGEFTSDSTIRLTRGTTGTNAIASWQVVEWDRANVISGTNNIATPSTVNLGDSVDQSRSFIITSNSVASATQPRDSMATAYFTSSSQIELYRTRNTGTNTVSWFVVETPILQTQSGSDDFSGNTQQNNPISDVGEMNKSFSINTNRFQDSNTAAFGRAFVTNTLTSQTNLALQKGISTSTVYNNWFVSNLLQTQIVIANPTPANNTITSKNHIFVNATITSPKLNGAVLSLNGTEYAMICEGTAPDYTCHLNKTNLALGNHPYKILAYDAFNGIISSENRIITIVDYSIESLNPLNNTKILSEGNVELEWEIGWNPYTHNCNIILNNVIFDTTSCDGNSITKTNITLSEGGVYDWKINYTDPEGNPQNTQVKTFRFIMDEHKKITKYIESVSENLYTVNLEITNYMNNSKKTLPIDFVHDTFNAGSFSPSFDFSYPTGENFLGNIYVWNLTIPPLSTTHLSYAITGVASSNMPANFVVGME